jgi:hypothetical protein
MSDIILTGKDYNNFYTSFSDLNIIRKVNGNEYLIENTNLENLDINSSSSITSNGVVNINYPITGLVSLSFSSAVTKNLFNSGYCRKELVFLSGTFTAHTTSAIYDAKSLGVSVKVNYNKYKKTSNSILTNSNYKARALVYEAIRTSDNLEQSNIIVENSLPNQNTKITSHLLGASFIITSYNELSRDNTQSIQPPIITSISVEDGTTIRVNYKILIWSGYDIVNNYGITINNELHLDCANSITFGVQGNSITILKNEFEYAKENSQSFNTDTPYELESNELMQYTLNENIIDRLSYKTAQDIFDKTYINTQLVTFDLLNIKEYEFGSGENLETRKLQAKDLIKIKNENGEFVGIYTNENGEEVVPYFEIIKVENIWDGSFYKKITCKQKI